MTGISYQNIKLVRISQLKQQPNRRFQEFVGLLLLVADFDSQLKEAIIQASKWEPAGKENVLADYIAHAKSCDACQRKIPISSQSSQVRRWFLLGAICSEEYEVLSETSLSAASCYDGFQQLVCHYTVTQRNHVQISKEKICSGNKNNDIIQSQKGSLDKFVIKDGPSSLDNEHIDIDLDDACVDVNENPNMVNLVGTLNDSHEDLATNVDTNNASNDVPNVISNNASNDVLMERTTDGFLPYFEYTIHMKLWLIISLVNPLLIVIWYQSYRSGVLDLYAELDENDDKQYH
ncbi:hypothetical protein Ccrd_005940, partial [Cynara cardunculus var. scolymus]